MGEYYKGCDRCIHSGEPEEECIERDCKHAFAYHEGHSECFREDKEAKNAD